MLSSSSPRKRRAVTCAAIDRIHLLSQAAEENRPPPDYLDRPCSSADAAVEKITPRQREKVVKYINELAEDFELCVHTGTLAVNIFDRYLAALYALSPSAMARDHRSIQMIASTCLLLASKFFDRKLPPLSELEKVHHNAISAADFAALELRILSRLRWKLHIPLPHAFTPHLCALCATVPCTPQITERIAFFIDLSVYGYQFLRYPPAAIAAAAILTAWTFSESHDYVPAYMGDLARACGIEEALLSACVNALVRYYQACFPEAAKQCAVKSVFIPISGLSNNAASRGAPSPRTTSASTIAVSPSPDDEARTGGATASAADDTASGRTSVASGRASVAALPIADGPESPVGLEGPPPTDRALTPESIMAADAALLWGPEALATCGSVCGSVCGSEPNESNKVPRPHPAPPAADANRSAA